MLRLSRFLGAPAAAVLAAGTLFSCTDPIVTAPGSGDGGPGTPAINGLQEIDVSPATLTLAAGETAQTQAYTASGLFADGHREDITKRVGWSVSPATLGRIDAAGTFTTGGFGGAGTITAISGSLTGSATLSVRATRVVVESDANGGGASSFTGPADAASAPKLVYPYDKVMMPPNLAQLEIHFLRGGQSNTPNTLFEITLRNQVTDLTIYTGCKAPSAADKTGCVYTLTPALWSALAYSNLDNDRDPVTIQVRGTNASTKVGSSAAIALRIAPQDLNGGIYYWTAAEGGTSGIYRVDLTKQTASPFYTLADAPADHRGEKTCVGCHALSHAGDRTTLVLGGGHISDLLMLSVAKPKPPLFSHIDRSAGKTQSELQFSNFQTFGADGSSFVSALSGTLSLLSAADGSPLIGGINTGGKATQPDWSRSGALLAFTRYSDQTTKPPDNEGDSSEFYIKKGAIGLLRWDANSKTFTDLRTLVAEKAGQNSYYPTVSPDDQYVVFNRAAGCVAADDCSAYHNPRAKLFITATKNGGEQELTSINRGGPNDVDASGKARDQLTNSWPKFSPFRQATSAGRTVLWVTFSSTRNYGVRLVQDPTSADARPQLWMAAIVVGGEPVGADVSAAPFWIPYQDLQTHNHIGQWTEQIVPILQ